VFQENPGAVLVSSPVAAICLVEPVASMLPVYSMSPVMFAEPPTYIEPPIPVPPVTINAPDVVEFDTVVSVMLTLPKVIALEVIATRLITPAVLFVR